MFKKKKLLPICIALGMGLSVFNPMVSAQELNATDLLNILVEEGVLSEEKAIDLVDKIRKRSERSERQLSQEAVQPSTSQTVRVPYVPKTVRQEIRDSVRQELRADVTQDVITHARTERWGIPDALPEWVNKVKISGDLRVRYQAEYNDEDNLDNLDANFRTSFRDINDVNDAGGVRNSNLRESIENITEDRKRLRGRARLMITAKPTEGFEVGMRLVTGDQGNPVSSNQTLGNYGEKWESNFDLAYIKYNNVEKSKIYQAGRFKNPFFHTDLVWDSDMTFEGIAGSWYFNRSDDMFDDFRQFDPYLTIGAFPINEINQATLPGDFGKDPNNQDIWLYAMQVGTVYEFINQSTFESGLSFYYYDNIQAVENSREVITDIRQDARVPSFFQFGNSLQDIRFTGDDADELYGLASEFEIVNATVKYGYSGFAPYQVVLTADYVKNIAFDREEVGRRSNIDLDIFPERDSGYQYSIFVGWPDLDQHDNWNVSLTYRNLEADAVVSSFADSDFLFGGTNAKGYILKGQYAIDENVWASLRWISADELDADVFETVSLDTLQLDLNAKF